MLRLELEPGASAAWPEIADDAPLPDGDCILSFARLQADGVPERFGPARLGVSLRIDEPVQALAGSIEHLTLIMLTVPAFRDGRVFTQARTLRERLDFTGEIRVAGPVLPDQAAFLERCGVSSLVLPADTDPAVWHRANARMHTAYQPSVRDEPAGPGLKRRSDAGASR